MILTAPAWLLQVSVRILGGLMALGYEIGTIMKRTSTLMSDGAVSVKLDNIEGMTHQFIQVGIGRRSYGVQLVACGLTSHTAADLRLQKRTGG